MGQNCSSCVRGSGSLEKPFTWDELNPSGRRWYNRRQSFLQGFDNIGNPEVVLRSFKSVTNDEEASSAKENKDADVDESNLDSGVASIVSLPSKPEIKLCPVPDMITEESSPQSQRIASLPERPSIPELIITGQGVKYQDM